MRHWLFPPATVGAIFLTAALAQQPSWDDLFAAGERAAQRGCFSEAEQQLQFALQAAETFAAADPRLPQTLNRLAGVLVHRGQLTGAEHLYKRALTIQEQALGPDDLALAAALRGLATIHQAQNNLAEGVPLVRRVIAIQERALGPAHPEVAESLYALARLHHHQKQEVEADRLYRQSLAIRAKALGETHPLVAESLLGLAVLRENQGRFVDAELFYQQSLAIRERALGPDHPDVAAVLQHYARLLRRTQRLAEADKLRLRANPIAVRHFRETRPETACPAQETRADPAIYRPGGVVMAPRLLTKVDPEYSSDARLARHEGTVELHVEISRDGRPENMELRHSVGLGLDEKAAEAVSQWRFEPATRGGLPVRVSANVSVNFRLL